MEISNAHHLQAMNTLPLEEVISGCPSSQQQEKRVRPQPEQALKCPRCESTNTKFCYYNNYSLSQPRYFCKGCRRYWTKGGSLRNVPVGGGCRKNKRSSTSSSSSSSSSSKRAQDQDLNPNSNASLPTLHMPPPLSFDHLSLPFARQGHEMGLEGHDHHFLLGNPNPNPSPHPYLSHIPAVAGPGFLDILRNGFLERAHPNGFHQPYFSFGGHGNVEEGGPTLPFGGGLRGSTTTTASTVTTHARSGQGSCKAEDGDQESKVLIGRPWQAAGDGNMGVDSGREYWNGVGSWHNLVNSSLL